MGYTTGFEGEFACHYLGAEGVSPFLRALHEGNLDVVGPMADWLMEHGDPRGQRVAEILLREPPAAVWRLFGLQPEHAEYLHAFSETDRLRRDPEKAQLLPDPVRQAVGLPIGTEGAYFVGGLRYSFTEEAYDPVISGLPPNDDPSIVDRGHPPAGQPGLWCHWAPNGDGTAIVWNGHEKFYSYVDWLEYLIEHFLAPWGYVLNGEMRWDGADEADRGVLRVKENRVEAVPDGGGAPHWTWRGRA